MDVDDCTSLEGAGVVCEVGASKFLQAIMSPFQDQTNAGKGSFISDVSQNRKFFAKTLEERVFYFS